MQSRRALLNLLLATGATACSGGVKTPRELPRTETKGYGVPPPPEPEPWDHDGPATGAGVFCAYGSVAGLLPEGANPADYEAAIAVVDLEAPAHTKVAVAGLELRGETGDVLASMREIRALHTLPVAPPTRMFAEYLNPPGVLFDGIIRAPTTRLRVDVFLNKAPFGPVSRYVVRLTMGNAPLELDGPINGAWPS